MAEQLPKPDDPDHFRMTFGEHLDDLRTRLVRALIGVGLAMIITLYFGRDIIAFLTVPLLRALRDNGLEPRLMVTGVASGFTVYFKVALIGGIILAAPWVVYQVWLFVATGLYSHERKVVHILAPFSTVMSMLGLLFMYFIMLPICLAFLITFTVGYPPMSGTGEGPLDWLKDLSAKFAGNADTPQFEAAPPDDPDTNKLIIPGYEIDPVEPADGQLWFNTTDSTLKVRVGKRVMVATLTTGSLVDPRIRLDEYIGFVTMITLGIVVGFQMPVVLLVGGWVQVLNPRWLGKYRKYCIFACAIVGAILTPADPISMIILAVPLYLLFEFGLLLARLVYRGRPDENNDEDGEDDNEDEPATAS